MYESPNFGSVLLFSLSIISLRISLFIGSTFGNFRVHRTNQSAKNRNINLQPSAASRDSSKFDLRERHLARFVAGSTVASAESYLHRRPHPDVIKTRRRPMYQNWISPRRAEKRKGGNVETHFALLNCERLLSRDNPSVSEIVNYYMFDAKAPSVFYQLRPATVCDAPLSGAIFIPRRENIRHVLVICKRLIIFARKWHKYRS